MMLNVELGIYVLVLLWESFFQFNLEYMCQFYYENFFQWLVLAKENKWMHDFLMNLFVKSYESIMDLEKFR
jgi:hypothetical protein